MVLYKQDWTSLQFFSYIQNYNYIGGINMILNNDYLENKEIFTYLNLYKLSDLIDSKVNLIREYSEKNKNFTCKVLFLENWNKESKIPVFRKITDYNNFKSINPIKYDAINSRINKYFSYFDIIESEEVEDEVYEEMFDTLVQIPTEIYDFVEIVHIDKTAKFISGQYDSNVAIQFGKLSISELDIAA
ncbi:MAG: hypothetical protein WBJ13_11355 [Sedimentibacter sp.]